MITLLLGLGADAVAGGTAHLVLSGGSPPGAEDALAPGSFTLRFEEATVAQGSYSGIRVVFTKRQQSANYDEMSLFIPSHDEFSVGYDSSKGIFNSTIPDVPFSFQAERSADVYDRRGRARPLKVELSHWHLRGKNHWSKTSIEFTDCEIKVEEMLIRDKTLSFEGSFECSSEETKHHASGTFKVNGAKLGLSKVD